MDKDWNAIDILRHARHDWLNKIQLIKGNIALNKIERTKEVIDEIVMEAQHEAKLSNLHITQFATLLLTYNWISRAFRLEFEVVDEPVNLNINDQKLTSWTESLLFTLEEAVEIYAENVLSISIHPLQEGARFFFDFSGIIINKEKLTQVLTSDEYEISLDVLTDNELVFEIYVQA